MTTGRTIPVDWSVLDALDQHLATLQSQVASAILGHQDTLAEIGQVRAYIEHIYANVRALEEEYTLPEEVSAEASTSYPDTPQSGAEPHQEDTTHAESPVEASTGEAGEAPPGEEAPPTEGQPERPRRARHRRHGQSA